MKLQQRIEWLLELQELTNEREQSDACIDSAERGGRRRSQHPEQLTDEQLQQILADDEMRQLVQQLGFAKRAFKHDELKNDTPDVDAEWEQFAATHAEALDALDEDKPKSHFHIYLFSHKIAASFIGVLLASGIVFAAVWSLTPSPSPKERGVYSSTIEDSVSKSNHSPLLGRGAGGEATYVFNNVPLDSMLTAIATAHGVSVEFENDAARGLRFHFVWKPEDSLTRVVEKLNTFEAVNIGIEDKTLVVR